MCPSYMATREEQHSTRGRANVLRLAMAGRLGEAGLGDEGVYETLDLCLECRACKAECPVGVDVARFKSEFLADYWQRHGTPLAGAGARQRAHAGRAGAAASRRCRTGSLGSAPARALNEARARHRPPAAPAAVQRRTLADARAARRRRRATPLLFVDTFTNYYDPEIGVAALDVLRSRRRSAPALAPQRLLRPAADLEGPARRRARSWRERNAERCTPTPPPAGRSCSASRAACRPCARTRRRCCAARRGARREAVARRERAVRGVRRPRSAHACRCEPGPTRDPAARPLPSEVDGAGARRPRRCCRAFPGATVVDLDAGCCGMAGSFGYARDHYEVSRAIGERQLFPAVRAAAEGTVVVAAGTSCRHQIHDFTGVDGRASGRAAALAARIRCDHAP